MEIAYTTQNVTTNFTLLLTFGRQLANRQLHIYIFQNFKLLPHFHVVSVSVSDSSSLAVVCLDCELLEAVVDGSPVSSAQVQWHLQQAIGSL